MQKRLLQPVPQLLPPDLLDEDDEPAALGEDPRVEEIARHFRAILRVLNADLDDPNLAGTPERAARVYLEIFAGLERGSRPRLTTFPNHDRYSHVVSVRDIPIYSMCAHHLLPFFGRAHLAYVPNGQIVGLSKLARIVDFYARRPQLQERLTEQVVACLEAELRPEGAMVVVQAQHLCMEMRGVQKPGAVTTTSAIRGSFEDRALREEFLKQLRKSRGKQP
jgi:GTP cyclohydrolase I